MNKKELYKSDSRWEPFVVSREEFVDKLVVLPNFNKGVPLDITEAFKTVTHLMAASYYYWPIYDEALSKALLIMEMAIKLKAKSLNLSLTVTNKGGRPQQKKLVDLITEICKIDYLSFLKPDFDRARHLRNSRMHPEEHFYMGGFGRTGSNAMLFINIINHLFSEKQDLQFMSTKRITFQSGFENFKKALFILDYEGKRILIESIQYHRYLKKNNEEWLFMLLIPILTNAYESITAHKFANPLVIALKSFEINDHTITGYDPSDSSLSISPTYKEENILALKQHYKEMEKVSNSDRHLYHTYLSGKALWQIEELIHNLCWL